MKKAFVTGASGFVGGYLVKELASQGYDVYGFDMACGDDILDYECLRNTLDNFRPDEIYHLAAQAFVPESFSSPLRTIDVNLKGTINLYEAVKNLGLSAKIQVACTSEEYGLVKETEVPIKETNELRPMSPYGVSKVGADMMGDWYYRNYGLHIVRTRAFNHTGPGRGEMYVESTFSKQVAEIEKSKKPGILKHGNLAAIRDFTDVRDMVKAYILAIQLPPDVYNIGNGEGHEVLEIIDILKRNSSAEIKEEIDRTRMRKTEVPILVADVSKFKALTNWEPTIPFEKTIVDILDYWRANV